MELALSNYQSWAEASLVLDGVTLVVGASNRGKSAFGRAIKGVLRNEILPEHIKLGTEGVGVTLNFDSHEIVATRGSKYKDSTVYKVDGRDYAKLGGAIPDDLRAMNFGVVDVNGVVIDPIFAGQFDGQFLVGASPADLNAVLGAFASTEKLDRGRKELAKRVTEVNAEARALTPQISNLEAQAADLAIKVEAVTTTQVQVEAHAATVRTTSAAIAALGTLITARRRLHVLQEQLAGLTAVDTTLPASLTAYKAYKHARGLRAAMRRLIELGQSLQVLAVLPHALVAADVRPSNAVLALAVARVKAALVAKKQQALEVVQEARNEALIMYKALVRLKVVLTSNPEALRVQAEQIADLSGKFRAPHGIVEAVTIIRTKLVGSDGARNTTRQALSDLGSEMLDLQTQREQVEADIEVLRAKAITCPKCGNEFTSAHSH